MSLFLEITSFWNNFKTKKPHGIFKPGFPTTALAPAGESLNGTGLLNESCLATAQCYTKRRSHQVRFSLSEQDSNHKAPVYNSNGDHSKLSAGIWTPTHADKKPSPPAGYTCPVSLLQRQDVALALLSNCAARRPACHVPIRVKHPHFPVPLARQQREARGGTGKATAPETQIAQHKNSTFSSSLKHLLS